MHWHFWGVGGARRIGSLGCDRTKVEPDTLAPLGCERPTVEADVSALLGCETPKVEPEALALLGCRKPKVVHWHCHLEVAIGAKVDPMRLPVATGMGNKRMSAMYMPNNLAGKR